MLEQHFATCMRALLAPAPFSPAPCLAVAVSGGADSMACVLLADAWARAHGGSVTALTVDHGLRAESREEAERVAAWMSARGITHRILTPAHPHASNNLQETARSWRYDALAADCAAHGMLHCLIAHHRGDNRETVAMMMARGDTADGAAGMSAVRNYRGVRFLRPLLGVEKDALVDYLYHQNAAWIEDPSNANADFARVRMRKNMSESQALRAEIDAMLATQAPAREAREKAQAAIAAQCVTIHPHGGATIDLATWRALDPAVASGLLADTLRTIGQRTHRPRAHETARLAMALQGTMKKRTLHGCEIDLHGGVIRIVRERRARESRAIVNPFSPPKPLAAAAFWWLK